MSSTSSLAPLLRGKTIHSSLLMNLFRDDTLRTNHTIGITQYSDKMLFIYTFHQIIYLRKIEVLISFKCFESMVEWQVTIFICFVTHCSFLHGRLAWLPTGKSTPVWFGNNFVFFSVIHINFKTFVFLFVKPFARELSLTGS